MKTPKLIFLGLLLAANVTGAVAAPKEKRPAYPLNCAGIVAGMSTDKDVRRMFGNGFFAKDEAHGGGRYFTDAKRRVTLHTEIGVDGVIESVSFEQGIHLPKCAGASKQAVSPTLSADESVGNGIRLRAKAEYVRSQFGKPSKETRQGSRRVIRYAADYTKNPYVLEYEAEFRFNRDRLVGVKLYNGE